MNRRLLLALVLALPACTAGSAPEPGPARVTVFAAASLTGAFTELAALSPDDVELSFAGSQTLVAQVQQGAPADVVVTADEASMRLLAEQVGEPVVLARNALAVVVERGNPLGLTRLTDLDRPDLAVVLGGPEVPVGRAARAALERAGVAVQPVSEEPDVKAVLAKVRLGEADAGIVYASDLTTADDVDGFELPGAVNAYPGAAVRGGEEEGARRFLALAASEEGQALLARFGFLPP